MGSTIKNTVAREDRQHCLFKSYRGFLLGELCSKVQSMKFLHFQARLWFI